MDNISEERLPQPYRPMPVYDVDQLIDDSAYQIAQLSGTVCMDALRREEAFAQRVSSEIISTDARRNTELAVAAGKRAETIRQAEEEYMKAVADADKVHGHTIAEIEGISSLAQRFFNTCRRQAEILIATATSRQEGHDQINAALDEEMRSYDGLLVRQQIVDQKLRDTESEMDVEQRTIVACRTRINDKNNEVYAKRVADEQHKTNVRTSHEQESDEIAKRQFSDEMAADEREESLGRLYDYFGDSGDLAVRKGDTDIVKELLLLDNEIRKAEQMEQLSSDRLNELLQRRVKILGDLAELDKQISRKFKKINNLTEQRQEIASELTELRLETQLLLMITNGDMKSLGAHKISTKPTDISIGVNQALPPHLAEVWGCALELMDARRDGKHGSGRSITINLGEITKLINELPKQPVSDKKRREINSEIEQVLNLVTLSTTKDSILALGRAIHHSVTSRKTRIGRMLGDASIAKDAVMIEIKSSNLSDKR